MKKLFLSFLALTLLISGGQALADAAEEAKADQATMNKFLQSDVVQKFAKSAYGYAVFPTIGKGGIIIGGGHGKGRVYVGGKRTGTTSMTQLSIGFQLGGEAYSELIFFEDKRAYDDFTSGEFEFGAQAQAIAITSSAGAGASTTGTTASANATQAKTKYSKGMAVFIMGKGGLMYEASVGGQKFNYKAD
jgi:lipid-binding SYLF domain-containing protein